MNWLIFVAISIATYTIVLFIDNYVSDVFFKGRESTAQKTFFAFWQVIISIIFAIIFGIDFSVISPLSAFLFFISGCIVSLSGIFYYRVLEADNTTNLSIFTQISPILYLILSWLFLGGTISFVQLIAFAVILAAPTLIILTARKRSRKVRLRAVLFAFIYVFVYVTGNFIFVQQDSATTSMGSELVWIFLGKGLGNLAIVLCHRKWFRRFGTVLKQTRGKLLIPMVISGILGTINIFAYYEALTEAPTVALASATSDSVTPIAVFFIGILLTLINPNFGREKLDKKSVIVHLAATILVVIGIVLIQK